MNEKLREIINHYGVDKQLKYFQSEIFELNEAIIKYHNKGIMDNVIDAVCSVMSLGNYEDKYRNAVIEEIADVMVMLKQFQLYYNIPTKDIREVMNKKIDRQLERIAQEDKNV